MSDTKFEALFVLEESRDCTVLSPAAGMKLSDVYRKFLCCEEVEIVASVRLLKGANDEDRVLIVVVNANTDVDCDFVNEVVTPIIGKTVLGKALLVLLVAEGADGDDARLANAHDIYAEMAYGTADLPVPQRVKALLTFFPDGEDA